MSGPDAHRWQRNRQVPQHPAELSLNLESAVEPAWGHDAQSIPSQSPPRWARSLLLSLAALPQESHRATSPIWQLDELTHRGGWGEARIIYSRVPWISLWLPWHRLGHGERRGEEFQGARPPLLKSAVRGVGAEAWTWRGYRKPDWADWCLSGPEIPGQRRRCVPPPGILLRRRSIPPLEPRTVARHQPPPVIWRRAI